MKTSARNQFFGDVVLLKRGAVNAEVVLRIDGGEYIAAIITNTSVDNLGLKEGNKAWASFKAASVVLAAADKQFQASARNQFFGKVTSCRKGGVTGEVTVQSEGGNTITAIVTNESIDRLGLNQGTNAYALTKAFNVLIAVES